MNAFPAAIAAALMLASFAAFGADPKGKVAAPTPSPVAVDAKGAADLKRAQQIVATRCSLCHGLEGESASPVFPRLAGQHPRYIEDQLKQFDKRERTNDNAVMHTVASKLTELEAHAVAEYIATLD